MATVLTNSPEALNHLMVACQKARSIAAEGGYLDLLSPDPDLGLPGLDRWVGDDRTLTLLADLAAGERPCDQVTWMNLAVMVDRSPAWGIALAVRGVEMPSPADAVAQVA